MVISYRSCAFGLLTPWWWFFTATIARCSRVAGDSWR